MKRLMHTFPATPSLQADQFARMLLDSSGLSVADASLSVGPSTFVTFRSPHDVATDQRILSAELDARRQELVAQRDEAWSPLDLATIVYHHVPRSTTINGTSISFVILSACYVFISHSATSNLWTSSQNLE